MKQTLEITNLDISSYSVTELNDSELNEIIGGSDLSEKVTQYVAYGIGWLSQTVHNTATLVTRIAAAHPESAATLPCGM